MAELIAARHRDRAVRVVGDAAYVGEHLRGLDDRLTSWRRSICWLTGVGLWRTGATAGVLATLTATVGTALTWRTSRFVTGDLICGSLLLLSVGAVAWGLGSISNMYSRSRLEADLAEAQARGLA